MAPPRSTRGGGQQRSTPAASRGSTRGGIQKNRGRQTRVDRDGDLDMDVSARGPNRSSKPDLMNPRAQRSTRSGAPLGKHTIRVQDAVKRHLQGDGSSATIKSGPVQRLVWLEVKGLKQSKAATNPDGGLKDLLSFLERKATSLSQAKINVLIKKSSIKGDSVWVAAYKEAAEEIIKLNTFMFAGAKLDILDSHGSLAGEVQAAESAQDIKAKLTNFMSTRYITDMKLLKLDALNQDQLLLEMGLLESKTRAGKLIMVMMKICDDLFKTPKDKAENIVSISLANNGLDSIEQVAVIAETFPDLINFDLSGNQISKVADLTAWKGKLRKLETLYLANNPILATDLKVRAGLLQLFPKLQNINGEQLTPAQLDEIRALTQPKKIPQHGPDFRDTNGIGENFLVECFAMFDADRHGLLAKYYDDHSQFSLAVDTNSIRPKDSPAPMSWSNYIPKSRNLTKITTPSARAARLLTGRESIFKVWSELPHTKHPNIKTDTTKYIMDCHLLPGLVDPTGQQSAGMDGMIISVHGQFEEADKTSGQRGLRSFSRSFVLGPGSPGQNPIRVISDMISLRAFNSLPNVFAAEQAQQAQPAQPAVAAPVAASNNVNNAAINNTDSQEVRQAKIAELCKQTKMTPVYSEMCLNDVQWDFARALAVFNEKKAQLPAEAFATV